LSKIRKSLLQWVFAGSYLMRWNDKLRPTELWEIDKQGHKMILAFVLWFENSKSLPLGPRVKLANEIIEGGIFDYFYRLVITDIKPPVFYRIKENKEHYDELTAYVLDILEPIIKPLDDGFWQRMCAYYTHDEGENTLAKRILAAAHIFASNWEFNLIKPLNSFDDEISTIDKSFQEQLESYTDLHSFKDILDKNAALGKFANLIGQLRFQIRWTQLPRIPATSVLGHMFLVAVYAYFFSIDVKACMARSNNNFFCGLLHDMPELLTRDIISPVKHSVKNLPKIIQEYEEEEMQMRIFNPLNRDGYGDLVERISYYLGLEIGSEFKECIRDKDGKITVMQSFAELQEKGNLDELDPKDGSMLKVCDLLAAFMEAQSSISNGISSPAMLKASFRLRAELAKYQSSIAIQSLLADFD